MSPSNVIVASSVILASKNTPYINAAADATAACLACWGNHSVAKSNGRRRRADAVPKRAEAVTEYNYGCFHILHTVLVDIAVIVHDGDDEPHAVRQRQNEERHHDQTFASAR